MQIEQTSKIPILGKNTVTRCTRASMGMDYSQLYYTTTSITRI